MDNIVQITNEIYINLTDAVKIENNGETYGISLRERDGSITVYYCHPDAPGHAKLKTLLTKAK